MKSVILSVTLSLFLLVTGCAKKAADSTNCSTGTVVDRTGLDGCGLLIDLDNGETLEPQVLPHGVRLEKDKKVCVQYEVLNDRASFCMAGTIVKITSLKYLP